MENAFNRAPRKMLEWAMTKKGLPEETVRAVMSFSHGAETKVNWIRII